MHLNVRSCNTKEVNYEEVFCSLMIALLIFSSASPTFADSRDLYCENIIEDQKFISITRDGP